MSICPIWNFTLYVTQSLHFLENHPYRKKKMWNQLKCTWYTACVLCIELVIRVDSLLKISHFVDIHVFVSFQLIWPKRLDFVISLRPSLCASVSENFLYFYLILQNTHSIDDVMVSELAWSVVDRELEPWSGQTKDYKIGICCFSTKEAALRSKNKDWLARNQNDVSEWDDMSIRGLLFQWDSVLV
jgi:hypothetical protein